MTVLSNAKYLYFLFVLACSQIKPIAKEIVKPTTPPPVEVFAFNPIAITINPGKVHLFKISLTDRYKDAEIQCRGERIETHYHENKLIGIILESYFSNLKPFECYLHIGPQKHLMAKVKVVDFKYPEERIKVDQKKIELSAKDQARVQREQVMLNKIYTAKSPEPFFKESFESPLKSYVTSYYGKKRVFNNMKKSQHLGIDFRAKIGVPIPSTNSGKVVYSGDLFFTGLTVIIYHGLDIYSVYGHISRLDVRDHEFVKKGQVIGLSGASGRVSGPHLHWGVKIRGNYIDGFSLISESQKVFAK